MRKIIVNVVLFFVITFIVGLLQDMQTLHQNVIRLHVVGASDSESDQNVKLAVKDAVNVYLQDALKGIDSADDAMALLYHKLGTIQSVAETVLRSNGFDDHVSVTLEQEAFPIREYETFTMPSGVYESLRIRIGKAEGKNWWCVVFPSLCLSSDSIAVSSGFSESLNHSLTGEDGYQIRFFLLDWLGQLQNFWFER